MWYRLFGYVSQCLELSLTSTGLWCLFVCLVDISFADVTSILCLLCKAVTNHTKYEEEDEEKKTPTYTRMNERIIAVWTKEKKLKEQFQKKSAAHNRSPSNTTKKLVCHNGIQRKYVCFCVYTLNELLFNVKIFCRFFPFFFLFCCRSFLCCLLVWCLWVLNALSMRMTNSWYYLAVEIVRLSFWLLLFTFLKSRIDQLLIHKTNTDQIMRRPRTNRAIIKVSRLHIIEAQQQ